MNNNELNELIDACRHRLVDYKNLQQAGLIPLDGNFFPSGVHYPPITMYQPMTEDEMFKNYELPADGKFDIYVHIPFCKRRCVFCHYPSLYNQPDSEKDIYLDALEKEMDIYMARLGVDKIRARSILLGGGTPTDLTPKQLQRFLEYFTKRCDLSRMSQFNYDVDPWTLIGPDGLERLRIMRDYGVDRLTIGIQSLDDKILKKMNRAHGVDDALESIKNCQDYGYQVNIEFIYGYPGQTFKNWVEVLEKALAAKTEEIQFYRLKVEAYGDQQGTIKKVKEVRPEDCPSSEDSILMKQISIELLARHGYHENLRRVFTTDKKYISKYAFNQCCNLLDEIGLGQTAFSSLHDRFILNTPSFDEYYKSVAEGRLPLNRGIVRNTEEQLRWSVILPLKNYSIRKKVFEKANPGIPFGSVYREQFDALKQFGLITENETEVALTRTGAFFSDEIVEMFHARQYIGNPESNFADGPLNPYKNAQMSPLSV